MPIHEREQFKDHFLGDTKEEAERNRVTYQNMVRHLARLVHNYTSVDLDDLIQEGFIGLARAFIKYDPSRGESFISFASVCIRDAMKELVTTQKLDINIPQYVTDANRLAEKLKTMVGQTHMNTSDNYVETWNKASKILSNKDGSYPPQYIDSVKDIVRMILSLAERSRASAEDLLERAEDPPTLGDIDMNALNLDSHIIDSSTAENFIMGEMENKDMLSEIQNLLTEDEFNLMKMHIMEGKTVRELAPVFGVEASTLTVRVTGIKEKVRKYYRLSQVKRVVHMDTKV